MSPSLRSAVILATHLRAIPGVLAEALQATLAFTLSIQKPGAPDTLLRMRSAPLGMRVKRRRASFISAPVVFSVRELRTVGR